MRVLITGANRGIGAGLLAAYKKRGDDVIGTSRSGQDGLLPLDVRNPGSFGVVEDALGTAPLDLLICNAGIYADKGHALETGFGPDIWADSFATNVAGVFFSVRAALQNLRIADGRIAVISSQMASHTRAPGGSYAYRASKAAALNLGRNLAADLASDGVSVGIYHPGWVQTDMGGGAADITVDEAVAGLIDRFDALGPETSGVFETWDGRPHPF